MVFIGKGETEKSTQRFFLGGNELLVGLGLVSHLNVARLMFSTLMLHRRVEVDTRWLWLTRVLLSKVDRWLQEGHEMTLNEWVQLNSGIEVQQK